MANASSMILDQEACWSNTTYRKYMQTNLDMARFMLQIISVVPSIQVEAVSPTHYFLFYEKWFWFLRHFYEGCFVAKERFLEMWTWSWILAII